MTYAGIAREGYEFDGNIRESAEWEFIMHLGDCTGAWWQVTIDKEQYQDGDGPSLADRIRIWENGQRERIKMGHDESLGSKHIDVDSGALHDLDHLDRRNLE
jgi:hypothetical protein